MGALKYIVKDLGEVEERFRELYQERTNDDGSKIYVLQVEGAAPVERVKELQERLATFRKNNIRLAERLKVFAEEAGIELSDDMTPEDLADMLKAKKKEIEEALSKGKRPDREELEKQVQARLEQLKAAMQKELQKVQSERDALFQQLERKVIETEVVGAALKRGLRPSAQLDLVMRARQIFRVRDGKLRALSEDGETPIYGPDGVSELTVQQWIDQLASKEAPHLFEANSGGGAPGGSGGAGRNGWGGGPNPWRKDSWNVTRQMELIRRDPVTARRLAEEAGVKLPAIGSVRQTTGGVNG
jgi:hypothetical protein